MFKKLIMCVAISTIALGSFVSCTKKQDANEILVGEYGSLTGNDATFGLSTNKGIRMAFDEVNAAGGVKGKKIRLITLDDQGKSEEAAAVVTRLVTQDKVVAVIGEVASSRSLAAAPIAQKYQIPMISPSSTNPKVTEVGNYIFRVCFIDPFQGTVMAKFATDNLKVKKVAVFRDIKSDYSIGLSDFFAAKFKELGGSVALDVSYQGGDIDFKAQLTQIRSSGAEAIFVPGYYTEVGLIAKQARQLGIKIPLLGGDGWDSSKLYEIGQEAINGNYFSNHYTTESTDPIVKDFITKFQEKYKEVPDGLAALGYDSAKILVKAMDASVEITPSAIRDQLEKISNFPGVTGKITINKDRNADKSAVVVQVSGNSNKFITTINP